MPFGPGNPYRFQPGNPGGPGRPPRSQEDRILTEMIKQLDDDTLAEVVAAAIKGARAGQVKHLRFLAEYLIGTPVQRNRVDVSQDMIDLLKNWREADKDTT